MPAPLQVVKTTSRHTEHGGNIHQRFVFLASSPSGEMDANIFVLERLGASHAPDTAKFWSVATPSDMQTYPVATPENVEANVAVGGRFRHNEIVLEFESPLDHDKLLEHLTARIQHLVNATIVGAGEDQNETLVFEDENSEA